MKHWKDILDEKIGEYSHLSPEELEAKADEAFLDIIENVLPAMIIQAPPMEELLELLESTDFQTPKKEEEKLDKKSLLMKIDHALDEKNKNDFLFYSKKYKELTENQKEEA